MTELYLAVDETRDLLEPGKLDSLDRTGLPFGIKINLHSVLHLGLSKALDCVRGYQRNVFVDLKMWNGASTMAAVLRELDEYPWVKYMTAHALGDDQLAEALASAQPRHVTVAAVTVLTHYDPAYMLHHYGKPPASLVCDLARAAAAAKCGAVVVPGPLIFNTRGLGLKTIVPGIREEEGEGHRDGRHRSQFTPKEARDWGADIAVCGRPILNAEDPVAALRRIHGALQ